MMTLQRPKSQFLKPTGLRFRFPMASIRRDPIGLTLLEILLGLSIFSIIALSLYSVYSQGIKLNQKSENLENLYREARLTMETLSLDLENMVPFNYRNFYDSTQGAFIGNEQSISFLVAAETGLRMVRYRLKNPEETKIHQTIIGGHSKENVPLVVETEVDKRVQHFIREEGPFFALVNKDMPYSFESEILSRNIREGGLQFFYAFQKEKDQPGMIEWREEWSLPFNPAGVRVKISFLTPDNKSQPLPIQRDIMIPTGSWGKQMD